MKKVALVTGVASGIGRASAEVLLKNGIAVVGLSRVGSYVGHGSGDVVLGFTTANRHSRTDSHLRPITVLSDTDTVIDQAFRAAVECVEESILNSLSCADRVTGSNGTRVNTLPSLSEFLPELMATMWADASVGNAVDNAVDNAVTDAAPGVHP